jgi:hypothetical protein
MLNVLLIIDLLPHLIKVWCGVNISQDDVSTDHVHTAGFFNIFLSVAINAQVRQVSYCY